MIFLPLADACGAGYSPQVKFTYSPFRPPDQYARVAAIGVRPVTHAHTQPRRLMTHNVISPPSIIALRKV